MSRQQTISTEAWIGLLTLATIWGGSFLAFEFALRDLPVLSIVAIRVGLASLCLWALILWRRQRVALSAANWAALLVMGLFNNVLPFSLIVWGQTRIESGLASILNATTAIFGVLVAAAVFSDEKLTRRKLVGVIAGFAGVIIVIGPDTLLHLDLHSLAQLAVLGASLSYALAGSWARRMLRGIAPEVSAAGMLTMAALVMVPAALMIDGLPAQMPGPKALAALFYIAVIATALAYLFYYRVLALAGSGNLTLVTLLVAPVAVLLGAVVLGEQLHASALAGFAVLALGMLVLDGRALRLFSRAEGDMRG